MESGLNINPPMTSKRRKIKGRKKVYRKIASTLGEFRGIGSPENVKDGWSGVFPVKDITAEGNIVFIQLKCNKQTSETHFLIQSKRIK